MGYPIYKLIRAVNRQYPNNGFIDYVDVRENMYHDMIDEDLRDLINETLQEVYIHVAVDEVYSFPTVPGQNQYVLPDDCDLRDIQEVTRTFWAAGRPMCHPCGGESGVTHVVTFDPNGGTGEMEPVEVVEGTTFVFPECVFVPPEGKTFGGWGVDGTIYQPGDEIEMHDEITASAVWVEYVTFTVVNVTPADIPMTLYFTPIGGIEQQVELSGNGGSYSFELLQGKKLTDYYTSAYVINFFGDIEELPTDTPITTNSEILFTQHTIGTQVTYTIRNVTPADLPFDLIYTEAGSTEQHSAEILGNGGEYVITILKGRTLGYYYSSMYAVGGETTIEIPLNVPITTDTVLEVTRPVVEPDPEEPADNGDGGNGGNPLDDNSGNGGNPLDDDNNQGGASPVVEPDPEEPIGGAEPTGEPDDEEPIGGSGGYGNNPLG